MHRSRALGNPLVRVFDHDDGPVHEHPHRKDQAEHDNVRHAHTHQRKESETQQERGWNRETDKQRRPRSQCRKHHDHHQRHRRQHRAFKLAHHGADDAALVIRCADLHDGAQFFRPARLGFGDRFANQRRGVDEVETFALDDLKRHGAFAVEPCGALAILKGEIDLGQIAKGHNAVAIGFDRKAVHIIRPVKGRRDLDRKRALFGLDLARRDEKVVVLHNVDQFAGRHVVGFKAQRVDDHFEHLVAVARNSGLKHRVHAFQIVLQILCYARHGAFRHRTGEVHNDDRKLREVDFIDGILLGPVWKIGLCFVHRVTNIGHDRRLVPAEFKLQRDARVIFRRRGGHFLEPVEIGKFGLHGFDKQGFGIRGRNAGELDRNEQRRNFDIRLAFLGKRHIGKAAHKERQHDKGKDHAGAFSGP